MALFPSRVCPLQTRRWAFVCGARPRRTSLPLPSPSTLMGFLTRLTARGHPSVYRLSRVLKNCKVGPALSSRPDPHGVCALPSSLAEACITRVGHLMLRFLPRSALTAAPGRPTPSTVRATATTCLLVATWRAVNHASVATVERHRIRLPRLCASTRRRSSADTGLGRFRLSGSFLCPGSGRSLRRAPKPSPRPVITQGQNSGLTAGYPEGFSFGYRVSDRAPVAA
jgi:hypothetical protein